MNAPAFPSRRDEAWRYADLPALERVWDRLPAAERIVVPAGERRELLIDEIAPLDGVALRSIEVEVSEGAQLAVRALVAGADYARLALDVRLGEGADFQLGGAILSAGKQRLEIVTDVTHAAPNATSRQLVRSVVAGQATASFLGTIRVARGAQKTDAEQSFKAMLLDRGASANARPELEIFADDVKCAHGATVGELDAAGLFYMAARGLPPATAKRLMLQAFVADALGSEDEVAGRAQRVLEAML